MHPSPLILADGDDFPVKVVFGVIVLIFWGIGALANMAKKQQSQQEVQRRAALERSIREQAELARRRESAAGLGPTSRPARGPSVPPLAAPPPFQRNRPRGPAVPPVRGRGAQQPARRPAPAPPPVPAALRPPQQQKKQAQRRRTPAAPEPRSALAAPAHGTAPMRPGVLETEIGQGAAPASPSRRAAAAAGMLRLTPNVLRQQFILTEILQPPLALRDKT